jgi:hypothetical protein
MSDLARTDADMEKLTVRKQRSRANPEAPPTSVTATSASRPEGSSIPIPPTINVADYDPARLTERLRFADKCLAGGIRRPTPRSTKALLMYKDVIGKALDAVETEEHASLVSKVQLFDTTFNEEMFLVGKMTENEAEFDLQLVKMREYSYFARYGDYLADALRRFRQSLGTEPTVGWEVLNGASLWTDIWSKLKAEHAAVPKPLDHRTINERETWFSGSVGTALWTACDRLSLDPMVTMKCIETYADRNAAFHRDFNAKIMVGDFASLARTIHSDLKELEMAIPPTRQDDLRLIRKSIEDYRDYYFDIRGLGDPNDPGKWPATATALAISAKLVKQEDERKERERRRANAAVNIDGKKKRLASTEVPRDSEKDDRDEEEKGKGKAHASEP